MLTFWQTSRINTSLLIENPLVCGAEKVWDESDKEEVLETSELVNEYFGSYNTIDCCQVPR